MSYEEIDTTRFEEEFNKFSSNVSNLIPNIFKSTYDDVTGSVAAEIKKKNFINHGDKVLNYLEVEMKIFNDFMKNQTSIALWIKRLTKAARIILKSMGHFFDIPFLEIMDELLALGLQLQG